MTETMIDIPGVIAKSDDSDFLRDLIRDAAQRLMDIEVAAVCRHGADLFVLGDLFQQVRQDGAVAVPARGELHALMSDVVVSMAR